MNDKKCCTRIPKFRRCVIQNFPFIEQDFDALTDYGLICKIVEYLNKVIDSQNEVTEDMEILQQAFVELKSYVDNYFENLDVQEEINNKLEAMAESGELAEIINEEIFGELNQRVTDLEESMEVLDITSQSYLDMQRKARWFYQNFNHPDHVSGQDFPYLQGGVYVGNDKFVIVRIRDNEHAKLQEISAIDGSVIRSVDVNVGHGNSITYNPTTNKLYITSLVDTSDNPTQYVYEYNYSTFALVNTISVNGLTANEGVHSIGYDMSTDKYYLGTETKPTNNYTLYEFNPETGNTTLVNIPDSTGYLAKTDNNDMCAYNGLVYIMKHAPQMILVYNPTSLELVKVYNIRENNGFGYNVGELENLSFAYDKPDKDLYIITNKTECNNGFYHMAQFFSANVTKCVAEGEPIFYNVGVVLYVDINSTSANPDGSSNNKFKHISEAIDIAHSRKNIQYIAVANGTYPYVYIKTGCGKLIFYGTNIDNTIINGIGTIEADYLALITMSINNTNSNQNYDLVFDTGNYKLSNVKCIGSNQTQHISVHNVHIDFYNVAGEVFYCTGENTFNCLDNTPDYKYYNNRPTMLQPVKIATFSTITSSTGSTTQSIVSDMINNTSMILKLHGYYSYLDVKMPANYGGDRNTGCTFNEKLISLKVSTNTTNNTIALSIYKAHDLYNGSVTDITSSATLDGTVWVQ